MGLFKKLKDILYDEEEYTEQIKITPEMRNEEIPSREEVREAPKKEMPKKEAPVKEETEELVFSKTSDFKKVDNEPVQSERELFQSNQFPFMDFDEEEFKQNNPQPKPVVEEPVIEKPVTRTPNVLEYERTKKVERRTDYGRYEKTEITQTTERKKFKPSPTISPVYGILNKDYEKEDVQQRVPVDVQSVRDKAFGEKPKEEVKPKEEKVAPKTTFYQETDTVTISAPVNKEQKVKTIDELLEDTEIEKKPIDEDLERELDSIEAELDMPRKTKVEEPTEEMKTPVPEDTLENDLFNLIDSMYDNSEDGE